MASIRSCPIPEGSLLQSYRGERGYVDCYATDIAAVVSHAGFVTAFYTTSLFKLERLLLKWAVARPSTDLQAAELASGARDRFAAWDVEARERDQLLLADFTGRTRSWLMVTSRSDARGAATTLYFGSAVIAQHARTGTRSLGWRFRMLLGFHKLYSRALLRAARARVLARAARPV